MKHVPVAFSCVVWVEVPDDCDDDEMVSAVESDFQGWSVEVLTTEDTPPPKPDLQYHRAVTNELLDVRSCAMGGNGDEGTFPWGG